MSGSAWPPPPTPAPGGLPPCPHCGSTDIPPYAVICPNCGHSFNPPSRTGWFILPGCIGLLMVAAGCLMICSSGPLPWELIQFGAALFAVAVVAGIAYGLWRWVRSRR